MTKFRCRSKALIGAAGAQYSQARAPKSNSSDTDCDRVEDNSASDRPVLELREGDRPGVTGPSEFSDLPWIGRQQMPGRHMR
jgi:hypothetical protein